MNNILLSLIFLIYHVNSIYAWDAEQLEVFDAVDEVKENFYTLLNVTEDATNQEIKSAFRALSLKLHPDKNPDEDTSVQFRNLVSVYEILRNPARRKYYDEVLVNGLPNWRSAVYYYRYVRKMGMGEACIILFTIFTIAQYLVNWGAYLERKYTLEQNLGKRRKQNNKTSMFIENELNNLQSPSFYNTLPFQIPRAIFHLILSIPKALGFLKSAVEQKIEEIQAPPPPQEEEIVEVPRPKTARKRNKGFVLPEGPNFETPSTVSENGTFSPPPPVSSGGLWTDDDLEMLTRLVNKKYAVGTLGRWEKIAEEMGRSVAEVTYMANKMNEKLLSKTGEEEPVPVKVKQKTRKETDEENGKKWSQVQQKALEDALAKYPKGHAERWDRIAECVPHKTKEECMVRFKSIVLEVKQKHVQ